MSEAFLGIDIGTSSCKVIALGSSGEILASSTSGYDFMQPRPGWAEQDPASWVEGARSALSNVLKIVPSDNIRGIGLSGQMHGLTPLDSSHNVLRPAILWNDQRNPVEANEIVEQAGGLEQLLGFTNNQMLVGYTGGKILWMKRHEPELFEKLTHILNPKDYLRLVLTCEIATEVSDASGTGLLDIKKRKWCTDLIDKLPIDQDILPSCFESHEISGSISKSAADYFGLKEGIPVVGGGGDSVIQTIGSGVISPGELQTTIGTAGIMATALDTPLDNPDGRLQVFCNVSPDKWHCMGVSLNAGGALSWYRSLLAANGPDIDFDKIVDMATESTPGAKGLRFLPYLNGERCPYPNPDARASFIGLTAHHEVKDMARAVMEGVVFALRDMYALMKDMGIDGHVIKASGGGAQSEFWRQMQSDIFDCDVVTTEGAAEGAAFGAALVAGVGLGCWENATVAAQLCKPLSREKPNQLITADYHRAFSSYRRIYTALEDEFYNLAKEVK